MLAEKPCALTEADLDAIIQTARTTGKVFHEMAGTAYEQPYYAMQQIIQSGVIGEVVQVIAEKSYPYCDWRAQDEDEDGGLICQNGIHALRFVEHVAGMHICSIRAFETKKANPLPTGELRMAASIVAELSNGGVASIACNYLNPRGTGIWGDESLKILGSKGILESRSGGQWTRLIIGSKDCGPIDVQTPPPQWHDLFFKDVLGMQKIPMDIETELSPTRWAIRAKLSIIDNKPICLS